ncbi:C39 family peptidase [Nocardioides sp. GXQ0305]|uniref:C39 family peptidase n=1 Tax=Nocardioides sp. GXQ0305 TaxID=3423912 RepID=UPI003D7C62BC
MTRNPAPLSARLTPARLVVAASAALVLVVGLSVLLPDREAGDQRDGTITTVTEQYAATTGVPGKGTITPAARAEIQRVLDDAPGHTLARATAAGRATQLVRCAEFEEQQYCLGRGWTDAPEGDLTTEAASAARSRALPAETTGDLTDADLLAQRAALSPAELEATERQELEEAARSVAKVVLLRHQILGEPLPDGFLERHPEARAGASELTAARMSSSRTKGMDDYPKRATVLRRGRTSQQVRTYWCGPATMQMIAWGWSGNRRSQRHWARRLGTTTSGSSISEIVRVVNKSTGYDREARAGKYIVLDISDWRYRQWMLLQMRHVKDYRAPLVLHPILLKRFFPYLDDDASGHFQVGRGYDKNGDRPGEISYFEPWNQQRFDPSEPYIKRVQWRRAYNSYRANRAHPHQNMGV